MKFLALALTLGFAGAAAASDFSSVGTTGVQAIADYSYARSINTPYWDSTHVGLAGLQLNFGGLGSVAVEAGDTQRVTDFRLNYTTFAVGYANGFHVGSIGIVGAVSYSELTGDKWFLDNGNNSSLPISNGAATVEVNAPVTRAVKVFVDYGRTYAWSGNINSFYKNAAVVTSAHGNDAAVGAYVDLSKRTCLAVGYTRGWSPTAGSPDTQGVLVSLSYKL